MRTAIITAVTATLALGVHALPKPEAVAGVSAPTITSFAPSKVKRASSLPASSGTSALDAVYTIAAGESFDGGMFMYDRGVDCDGQTEGGDSDAVFQIEAGGSLSNVIIGPNQMEGVHCQGACTLTNVWWSAVCEDAFTIKNQDAGDTTYISGGGAFGADDKVLQHNGAGTLDVSDFVVETFGKLYRSCGNCDSMYERHVIMDSITATDGSELAGINYNYGDSATFTNIAVSGVDDICVTYTGTDDNSEEPTEYGSGADGTYCIYSDSDVSGDTSSSSSSDSDSDSTATTSASSSVSTSDVSSDGDEDSESTDTSSAKATSTKSSSDVSATSEASSTTTSSDASATSSSDSESDDSSEDTDDSSADDSDDSSEDDSDDSPDDSDDSSEDSSDESSDDSSDDSDDDSDDSDN